MPFSLDYDPSNTEIAEAVNYLLANFSNNVSADQNSGQVIGPSGEIVSYLYKYIQVKYADSFDGSVNFSNVPTNRLYYGLRNTDSLIESTNPADYVWTQVTGGFGTTKFLWYLISGGRSIQFQVATTKPNPGWVQDGGAAIDLDYTTTAGSTPANFVVIRIPNNSAPPTNAEVLAAIGRDPVEGDLCTVNYNSGLASLQYKYQSGGWAVFQKYITGDLVVAQSIVGNNIAANTVTASNINGNNLLIKDAFGNVILGAGYQLGGTYIADASITTAKIGNLQVDTAKIANQAVSIVTTFSATYQPGQMYWGSLSHTFSIPVSMPKSGDIAIICTIANRGSFDSYTYYSVSQASITNGSSFSGGGILAGISFTLISQGNYSSGTYTFDVSCSDTDVYNPGWDITALIIRTFK